MASYLGKRCTVNRKVVIACLGTKQKIADDYIDYLDDKDYFSNFF